MKIILTGATGFLGTEIQSRLNEHSIITLARQNAIINCDLSTAVPCLAPQSIDIVIHAAGKAHSVPTTELEKQAFFDANVTGTKHLLEALEKYGLPESFIYISSVSVYGLDKGDNIPENAPLLAEDAYGKSKIIAESLVQDWCNTNNVLCSILRLPLLVGISPPGNLRSMIKGIREGKYVNIGGGLAKKSMVLTKDIAEILPIVAKIGGIYNLTDGYHPSFRELSEIIANQSGKKRPLNIPIWVGYLFALVGDVIGKRFPFNSKKLKKIIMTLTFDDSKARKMLRWKPTPVLEGFKDK